MKKAMILFTIAIVLFSISGCSSEQDSIDIGEIEEGVDYFIFDNAGISLPLTSFKTLNPLYMDNLSYYHLSKLIFEGLFEYDQNLQPIPRLASTYTISEDGKTVEVSLRQDIYWHNGEKLHADDVVFTIGIMKQAGADSFYGKIVRNGSLTEDLSIISARALSESRVEISFKEATGNVLDILTFPIIPEAKGADALVMENYIPIGTGPYKFAEHIKFKEVHLESNEQYRDGEPQISYIVGKIYDDRELILTAFETGKLHMAPTIGVDWDKYEHNERISIYEYVSGDHEILAFNHMTGLFSMEGADSLKKAIFYGIDRQSIIDKVYLQHGTQVDTPLHPSSYLASLSSDRYGFNVDNARDLLESAGFVDSDNDGILEDSEGNPIVLRMLVNHSSDLKMKTAEMLKTSLKEIGLSLQIIHPSGESSEGLAEDMTRIILEGDYDISLLHWEQSTIPAFRTFLGMNSIYNFAHYSDENLEEILSRMELVWDENSKIETYEEFQQYYVETIPYGSLLFRNKALLVDSGISGDLEPTYYNLYNGLENCYLTMSTN
ncbi:ABC transporter substrate-binding protein [Gudongella sp. DL1XJH-153]|uniref:ABC transporter substrate-binding protein n=1 Tax=Gudongella sp. DL1XJH-153 TaxID=3409804 RepID=UPI003BB53CEF